MMTNQVSHGKLGVGKSHVWIDGEDIVSEISRRGFQLCIDNLDLEIQEFLRDGELMCTIGKELVHREDHRAIYWFRRAMDLNYPAASIWMAWCRALGIGCVENVEVASSYYDQAISYEAFDDFPVSMEETLINRIGSVRVLDTISLEESYYIVFDYLKHAIKRGSEHCMEFVSGLYEFNQNYDEFFDILCTAGVENEDAVRWMRRIASNVSPDRQEKVRHLDLPGQMKLFALDDIE